MTLIGRIKHYLDSKLVTGCGSQILLHPSENGVLPCPVAEKGAILPFSAQVSVLWSRYTSSQMLVSITFDILTEIYSASASPVRNSDGSGDPVRNQLGLAEFQAHESVSTACFLRCPHEVQPILGSLSE